MSYLLLCEIKCYNSKNWGVDYYPKIVKSEVKSEVKTLTNNTLISPRERFPSRATVGVESGATHIWSVTCK